MTERPVPPVDFQELSDLARQTQLVLTQMDRCIGTLTNLKERLDHWARVCQEALPPDEKPLLWKQEIDRDIERRIEQVAQKFGRVNRRQFVSEPE